MATIHQFRALRPVPEMAAEISCPPYDTMSESEARRMADGNPVSFLHVERAEIDFGLGVDPYSDDVYSKAAENLNRLIENGSLIKDEQPSLYIYRLTMNGHSQTGIVACTSVDEYVCGIIKKHELTREEKEVDRTKHMLRCHANTSPVFLAYDDSIGINKVVENWASCHSPIYKFKTWDKIEHTVWIINSNEAIKEIVRMFEKVPCLYIADGHHRYASAASAQKFEECENAESERNFCLSVIFPHDQLKIMEYNRLVKDLNGLTEDEFIEEITKNFYIMPHNLPTPFKPSMAHQFGMYLNGKWYILTADPENIPENAIDSLDVSILQNFLLGPVLGIDDPRTNSRISFLGGIKGLKELEFRVDSGEMKVAFSMFPMSMDGLMEISGKGFIMPPKSTWFEPKLRSGLFIHSFDE
ncbi:MAG: DUF1015 domain-containing protein [Firmicutes bacterium]|nr:DUF1015 domain-containing protein [Bacillota bacterium]